MARKEEDRSRMNRSGRELNKRHNDLGVFIFINKCLLHGLMNSNCSMKGEVQSLGYKFPELL